MENSHDSFSVKNSRFVIVREARNLQNKHFTDRDFTFNHFTYYWFHIDQDVNNENVKGFALWLVIFHMLSVKQPHKTTFHSTRLLDSFSHDVIK